jgi:hypothetical protein
VIWEAELVNLLSEVVVKSPVKGAEPPTVEFEPSVDRGDEQPTKVTVGLGAGSMKRNPSGPIMLDTGKATNPEKVAKAEELEEELAKAIQNAKTRKATADADAAATAATATAVGGPPIVPDGLFGTTIVNGSPAAATTVHETIDPLAPRFATIVSAKECKNQLKKALKAGRYDEILALSRRLKELVEAKKKKKMADSGGDGEAGDGGGGDGSAGTSDEDSDSDSDDDDDAEAETEEGAAGRLSIRGGLGVSAASEKLRRDFPPAGPRLLSTSWMRRAPGVTFVLIRPEERLERSYGGDADAERTERFQAVEGLLAAELSQTGGDVELLRAAAEKEVDELYRRRTGAGAADAGTASVGAVLCWHCHPFAAVLRQSLRSLPCAGLI